MPFLACMATHIEIYNIGRDMLKNEKHLF